MPDRAELAVGFLGPILSALFGVVMKHAKAVNDGQPFTWRRLLIDLPTVFGLGIIGGGVASYLGSSEQTACAVSAVLGYVGPQVIGTCVTRVQAALVAKATPPA